MLISRKFPNDDWERAFDGGNFYLNLTTLSHHLHSNCALNTGGGEYFC